MAELDTSDIIALSNAIGEIRATVLGLKESHTQKSADDKQFRKAMYDLMPTIRSNAMQIDLHSTALDKFETQMATLGPILQATTQLTDAHARMLAAHQAEIEAIRNRNVQAAAKRKTRKMVWAAYTAGASGVITVIWVIVANFGSQLAGLFLGGPDGQ